MATRQDIKVCLILVVMVMILMNLYTLLIFWKSKFDDTLIDVRKKESGSLYRPHARPHEVHEVSSVRFKVVGHNGQIRLFVPSNLSQSQFEYWSALETNVLAKLEYDEALVAVSTSLYENEQMDRKRRLRLAFQHDRRLSKKRFNVTQIWKKIDGWPDTGNSRHATSLAEILQFVRTVKIKQVSESGRGTQLKLELILEGDKTALFKPAWYRRDVLVRGDPYGGKDRHYGEVAAFYLAHILEYKSGPVVVARNLNFSKEVLPFSTNQLNATIYQDSNGDWCFYGSCYYCKMADSVCSNQGMVEGALVVLMDQKLKSYPNPWIRTYKKNQFAEWERNSSFCDNILVDVQRSQKEKFLLEIVAVSIFDFLIGNADRHHLDLFTKKMHIPGHLQNIALLDNGKSFGDPEEDYFDILAPLYQCCIIRKELYSVLRKYRGVLGKAFQTMTEFDLDYFLLTPAHLKAVDRRLKIVISTIEMCQDRVGRFKKVII